MFIFNNFQHFLGQVLNCNIYAFMIIYFMIGWGFITKLGLGSLTKFRALNVFAYSLFKEKSD